VGGLFMCSRVDCICREQAKQNNCLFDVQCFSVLVTDEWVHAIADNSKLLTKDGFRVFEDFEW